jgi:hypothetical protein
LLLQILCRHTWRAAHFPYQVFLKKEEEETIHWAIHQHLKIDSNDNSLMHTENAKFRVAFLPEVLQGQQLCDLLKQLLVKGCKDLQVLDQDFNSFRPIMPGSKESK